MTPWLSPRDLQPGSALRLFCIPHAGSGSAIYRRWQRKLPATLALCPISLPGREARLAEPSCERMGELLDHLLGELAPHLDQPYAIFGHSMGALIAYALAAAIQADGLPAPEVLFVSGRNAAHLPFGHHGLHRMGDTDFLEALQERFGGVPAGFLDDEELRSIFLPILRSDLRLVESYRHTPALPLHCPIVASAGTEDATVSAAGLQAWAGLTSGTCQVEWFPGGHFYHLGPGQDAVLKLIADSLAAVPYST